MDDQEVSPKGLGMFKVSVKLEFSKIRVLGPTNPFIIPGTGLSDRERFDLPAGKQDQVATTKSERAKRDIFLIKAIAF
jgi:hypothetical protein